MEKVYVGSPESASMPASCFLPYVEKMSIKNDITGQSISALHQYSSLEFSQEHISYLNTTDWPYCPTNETKTIFQGSIPIRNCLCILFQFGRV